jgi:hypothetical protein
MEQQQCSCAKFDHLEGASVPAYIRAFLEQAGGSTPTEQNRYRCRVCGRVWEKRAPEVKGEATRASLIRVSE